MRELVIEQTSGGGWFPVQIIVSFQTTVCIGHQLERERERERSREMVWVKCGKRLMTAYMVGIFVDGVIKDGRGLRSTDERFLVFL